LLHGTLANWQDGHDSFEQASVLARNLFGSKSPLVFRSGLNDARLYLEQSAFREATGRLAELEIFEPYHLRSTRPRSAFFEVICSWHSDGTRLEKTFIVRHCEF
jgi:hypothetical protein